MGRERRRTCGKGRGDGGSGREGKVGNRHCSLEARNALFLFVHHCLSTLKTDIILFSHSLSLALHSFGHTVPSQRCLGPSVVSTRHHLSLPAAAAATAALASAAAAVATTRLYIITSNPQPFRGSEMEARVVRGGRGYQRG